MAKAHQVNPAIEHVVFIHKCDGLSDDHKIECQRDIHQQATEDLADAGLDVHLSFFLTSIYDSSIHESMSKVIQRQIRQLPALENLLDCLVTNSRLEKAFLFDVVSKIYLATDSSPVDMQSYELCSDHIDVVIDVSCIYGAREDQEGLAYDSESSSVIRLNNGTLVLLREMNKYLALVCLLREEAYARHGLIDYNIRLLRSAITQVFEAGNGAPSKR